MNPKPSRPIEYPAYLYMACDAYSRFVFQLLIHDSKFAPLIKNNFTLVLSGFEDMLEDITELIAPMKGNVMYNEDFHKEIVRKPVRTLMKMVRNRHGH